MRPIGGDPDVANRQAIQISHEIDISSTLETAWHVTIDVQTWPKWSPTITRAQQIGSDALMTGNHFRLKQPLQVEKTWEVTAFEPPCFAAWKTESRSGVMLAEHAFSEKAYGVVSRLTLILDANRIVGQFLSPILYRALRAENSALKTRCEGLDWLGAF